MTTLHRPETQAFLDAVYDQLEQADSDSLTGWCDWESLALARRAWGDEPWQAAEWLMDNVSRPSIHRLQEVRRT